MPILDPKYRETRNQAPALKPDNPPHVLSNGGSYEQPWYPLPAQIDTRVPVWVNLAIAHNVGGAIEPEALQYYVSNRVERAGRTYSPRPVSLPGGAFNGDVLYVGTRDTGDVSGG